MNKHCEDPDSGDTIYYTSDSWVNANEAPVSLELLEGGTIEVPAEVAKKIGDGKSVSVEMFPDHRPPDPEVRDLYTAGEYFEYSSPHTTHPNDKPIFVGKPEPVDHEPDIVNHPPHYAEGRKYEPKDVIRDWGLNYNLGSAVKYISRAGRKENMIQDIDKAIAYLGFEREALLKEKENE